MVTYIAVALSDGGPIYNHQLNAKHHRCAWRHGCVSSRSCDG